MRLSILGKNIYEKEIRYRQPAEKKREYSEDLGEGASRCVCSQRVCFIEV